MVHRQACRCPSDRAVAKVVLSLVQVTNGLLENAMTNSGRDKFLIDGFPRNDENRAAFEVPHPAWLSCIVVACCACSHVNTILPGRYTLHPAAS